MSLSLLFGVALALALGLFLGQLLARLRMASHANDLQYEAAGLAAQVDETRKHVETQRVQIEALRKELDAERILRTRAESERQSERSNIEEQKRLLHEDEAKLREAFDSLAGKALEQSTLQFLQLAQERFANLQQEASSDLARRHESIRGMVDPLQERLTELQTHLRELETNRQSAYGELRSQVQQLAVTSRDLQKETVTLVSTLRQPQVKGRWGELTLRRAVELAGMSPHCDFEEQVSVDAESGRMRPDLIVHLPGGTQIVIDAKVPLHASFAVTSARSDAEYQAAMAQHASLVRDHMN